MQGGIAVCWRPSPSWNRYKWISMAVMSNVFCF
jgi:hypothetical protein